MSPCQWNASSLFLIFLSFLICDVSAYFCSYFNSWFCLTDERERGRPALFIFFPSSFYVHLNNKANEWQNMKQWHNRSGTREWPLSRSKRKQTNELEPTVTTRLLNSSPLYSMKKGVVYLYLFSLETHCKERKKEKRNNKRSDQLPESPTRKLSSLTSTTLPIFQCKLSPVGISRPSVLVKEKQVVIAWNVKQLHKGGDRSFGL